MNQKNEIQNICKLILGKEVIIESIKSIGGGSISNTLGILTNLGNYFLKVNSGSQALEMFNSELDGLETLAKYSNFKIPKVFGTANQQGTSYLLMELIEPGSQSSNFWSFLGNTLAELHRNQSEKFGYHRSNFIGSLDQKNNHSESWSEFFITRRMNPMIALARNQQLVEQTFAMNFDHAIKRIVEEMPVEPPSLIHGDLWSGNFMVGSDGNPTIIDPAVYYGHREMDLSFSRMFGGFSEEFYKSYENTYPLEPGFESRVELFNLYPQLVHLNLFGMSYFGSIDRTIRRFT